MAAFLIERIDEEDLEKFSESMRTSVGRLNFLSNQIADLRREALTIRESEIESPERQTSGPETYPSLGTNICRYLECEGRDNETTKEIILNGYILAQEWVLEEDEDNLEAHANLCYVLTQKNIPHYLCALHPAIAALKRLADRSDRRLTAFLLEAAAGTTPDGSTKEAGEASREAPASADTPSIKLSPFHKPNISQSICDARGWLVLELYNQYGQSQDYNISALDDLISYAEQAQLFLSAPKRLGLREAKCDVSKPLEVVERALISALTDRLFRYPWSGLPATGPKISSDVRNWQPCPPRITSPIATVTAGLDTLDLVGVSSDTIYENTRLSAGTKQIRLLDLQPAAPDEAVECTLRVVDLETHPEYDAVSYVWGDPSVLVPITVNGVTVRVTINLCAALRRLRLPTKTRCLWADAVCIKQEDNTEKQHQVGLMRHIYANAREVAMWIGEPWQRAADPRVECAPEFLSDMSNLLKPEVASALSPYFIPFPADTEKGAALSKDYSSAGGFRRTLEKLPEEFLPVQDDDFTESVHLNELFTQEAMRGSTVLLNKPFTGITSEKRFTTKVNFEKLVKFHRWAGSSQGQKQSEFDWKSNRSITNILRSPLNERQWPVVGAFVILRSLASGAHFNSLPFFDKNENVSKCRRQSWLKSLTALCKLLENPYWERAWIAQEVVLAKSPVLYYGPHMMPFSTVVEAKAGFELHSKHCCQRLVKDPTSTHLNIFLDGLWPRRIHAGFNHIDKICRMWGTRYLRRVHEIANAPKFELHELLLPNRNKRKATDPRDLVYSLLGLVDDDVQPVNFEADYTRPTVEVFVHATARVMQEVGPLALRYTDWREKNPFGVPSWSFDWTNMTQNGHGYGYLFMDGFPSSPNPEWHGELQGDHCLSVRSYKVDRIERSSETYHICTSGSIDDIYRQSMKWFSLALSATGKGGRFSKGKKTVDGDWRRKEEFLRTLVGGRIFPDGPIDPLTVSKGGRRLDDSDVLRLVEWWDWLIKRPTSKRTNKYRRWEKDGKKYRYIHESCLASISHMRFFVTTNGQFGLGPSSYGELDTIAWPTALEGDEIHIISGLEVPVLLRRLDTLHEKSEREDSNPRAKVVKVTGRLDKLPEYKIVDEGDLDLRARSALFSAPIDKCCHRKDGVYQFVGLCYVDGMNDGDALRAYAAKASEIFLR